MWIEIIRLSRTSLCALLLGLIIGRCRRYTICETLRLRLTLNGAARGFKGIDGLRFTLNGGAVGFKGIEGAFLSLGGSLVRATITGTRGSARDGSALESSTK